MNKSILLSIFLLLANYLFANNLVDVSSDDILYLNHFDVSLESALGNDDSMKCTSKITSGNQGFPIVKKGRNEALDLNGIGKYLLLLAEKNFDVEQGTLQMWVCPKWKNTAYGHCVFFQTVPKVSQSNKFHWKDWFIQKSPKKQVLVALTGGKEIPIVYAKDKWFQLALTWNKKTNKTSFYLNGELKAERKYRKIASPEAIMFSGPVSHNAQALIDEVRILKRVLTSQEIKQDFLAQLSGKAFSSPSTVGSVETYKPIIPTENTATLKIDAKEEFKAMAITNDFKVDGNLSKKIWSSAPNNGPFLTRSGNAMANKTTLKMLYSPNKLYIAASCYQDMKLLVAKYDQDEMPIWNDDNLEIFLSVPGKKGGFFQIVSNALGSTIDIKDRSSNFNIKGMVVKAKRYSNRWDIEYAIPFSSIGLSRPFTGDFIGARFCRAIRNEKDYGAYPRLFSSGNNAHVRIGKLNFANSSSIDSLQIIPNFKNFSLGINEITYKFKSDKAVNGKLRIILQDNKGNLLEQPSIEVKNTLTVKALVNISNVEIRKIISILEANGKELGVSTIDAGYPYVAPGINKMQQEIVQLESSLASLLEIDHPIYKSAFLSLQKIKKELDTFQKKLGNAIKTKKALPIKDVIDVLSHVNGFNKYKDDYRYLVWQISPWTTGAPDELPPKKYNKNLKFKFAQAENEREIISFVVSGLFCGNRLDLRVYPKTVSKKYSNFLSTHNFEVYTEPFLKHIEDTITSPLIPAHGGWITVTPGSAVRVWVIFNSKGVAKGKTFNTQIMLKPAYDRSVSTRSIPLEAKVWNFSLPATNNWPLQSFMWGPNSAKYDELAMMQLMHDYHFTHTWSKGFNYSHGFDKYEDQRRNPLPKGKLFNEKVTKTANEDFFDLALKLKMKFVFGWNLPVDPEFYRIMGQRLINKGFKPGDFVFKALIADEFGRAAIPRHQAVRDKVAQFKKDWHFQAVYYSAPPPAGATLEDLEKAKLPEFYKMWTVIEGLLADPVRGKKVISFLQSKGCEVWSYQCSRYMPIQAIMEYYRLYPWKCYMRNLTGMALWISGMGGEGDALDFDAKYNDGVTFRGPERKPIKTKQLEALREGLEDVAYMDILKKELQRVSKKGQKYPQYEKLLTVRKSLVEKASVKEVESWRFEVGQAIDFLITK